MAVTFTTTLQQAEDGNATGISVPPDAVKALGSNKRPPVIVTVNGYTYRSTIAPYSGDVYMISFASEHRKVSGIKAGDTIEVTLELDTAPRTVDVPADLQAALDAVPGASEAFAAQSYTNRKEAARQVTDAKTQATREKRIAVIVAKLSGKS